MGWMDVTCDVKARTGMTINYYQSSLRSADLAFFNLSSLRCKCVLEVSSSSTRACDSRS